MIHVWLRRNNGEQCYCNKRKSKIISYKNMNKLFEVFFKLDPFTITRRLSPLSVQQSALLIYFIFIHWLAILLGTLMPSPVTQYKNSGFKFCFYKGNHFGFYFRFLIEHLKCWTRSLQYLHYWEVKCIKVPKVFEWVGWLKHEKYLSVQLKSRINTFKDEGLQHHHICKGRTYCRVLVWNHIRLHKQNKQTTNT